MRLQPVRLALAAGVLMLAAPVGAAPLAEVLERVTEAGMNARLAALVGERATPEQQAATAASLRGALEACGYAVESRPVGTSENLIATLVGEQTPERVVVLGAHFDGVPGSPAADDDASGVAALLEIACALQGERLASSVQFVGFALEEVGLLGSSAHATDLALASREVDGMISLEMIGYTCDEPFCQVNFFDVPGCLDVSVEFVNTGLHIAVVANTASSGWKDVYVGAADAAVPELPLLWGVVAGLGDCISDSRRSDHAPFWDWGFPALLVTDTANFRNANYHQPSDTLDTLDVPFATRVARATLAAVVARAQPVPEPDAGAGAAAGLALAALGRRAGRRRR